MDSKSARVRGRVLGSFKMGDSCNGMDGSGGVLGNDFFRRVGDLYLREDTMEDNSNGFLTVVDLVELGIRTKDWVVVVVVEFHWVLF